MIGSGTQCDTCGTMNITPSFDRFSMSGSPFAVPEGWYVLFGPVRRDSAELDQTRQFCSSGCVTAHLASQESA